MAKFRFTLQELYSITDDMVREYQTEGLTEIEKGFIVADLIEVTEELIKNNCRRFIIENDADEVGEETLQSLANGLALVHALRLFNFERGIHFLTLWNVIQKRIFINEFKRCTTHKEKFHQLKCCSSDVHLDEDGHTIMDYKEESADITEDVVGVVTLMDIVKKFEYECTNHRAGRKALYGKIIKLLMSENKEVQRIGIKRILGEDATAETIRQNISRARRDFKEFLDEHNYYL